MITAQLVSPATSNGTPLGNAGLVHLKGLISLLTLDFKNAPIGNAGLEHLEGLTKLETLYLVLTQVSDTGLVHLK